MGYGKKRPPLATLGMKKEDFDDWKPEQALDSKGNINYYIGPHVRFSLLFDEGTSMTRICPHCGEEKDLLEDFGLRLCTIPPKPKKGEVIRDVVLREQARCIACRNKH